ncbi:unnamed protein product [Paramecium sonneborni]|uniref:Uncharacterized protein n=1 Tax=Paramecium sonneborni TaxID=65129 RepID=A0A8S1QM19_9CILI|nr:unnamed protein product [Paramecium sonneborni]
MTIDINIVLKLLNIYQSFPNNIYNQWIQYLSSLHMYNGKLLFNCHFRRHRYLSIHTQNYPRDNDFLQEDNCLKTGSASWMTFQNYFHIYFHIQIVQFYNLHILIYMDKNYRKKFCSIYFHLNIEYIINLRDLNRLDKINHKLKL